MRETLHFGSDFPFAAVQNSFNLGLRDTGLPEEPEDEDDETMEEPVDSTTLEIKTLYVVGTDWIDQTTSMGGEVLEKYWNDESWSSKNTRDALKKEEIHEFGKDAARFLHNDFVTRTKNEFRFVDDGGPFQNYTFTNEETEEEETDGVKSFKTRWVIWKPRSPPPTEAQGPALIKEMDEMDAHPLTRAQVIRLRE